VHAQSAPACGPRSRVRSLVPQPTLRARFVRPTSVRLVRYGSPVELTLLRRGDCATVAGIAWAVLNAASRHQAASRTIRRFALGFVRRPLPVPSGQFQNGPRRTGSTFRGSARTGPQVGGLRDEPEGMSPVELHLVRQVSVMHFGVNPETSLHLLSHVWEGHGVNAAPAAEKYVQS
jgi:hypothetical protein